MDSGVAEGNVVGGGPAFDVVAFVPHAVLAIVFEKTEPVECGTFPRAITDEIVLAGFLSRVQFEMDILGLVEE